MWRLTALTVRKSNVPQQQFTHATLNVLAPTIVKAVAGDTRLQRFIVNLPPSELDARVAKVFPCPFDGLLEFWFEGAAEAIAVMNGLSQNPTVLAAAAEILDGTHGVAWLAEVFPKKPEAGKTQIKFLAGGDAAAGWTVEDAQKYWSEVHPVVAQTAPKVWGTLTRYVQFHGRPLEGLQLGNWLAPVRFVPMCADMGFARQQDFLTTYTNDEYLSIVRPDEERFSRPGEMLSFVSGEERYFVGSK